MKLLLCSDFSGVGYRFLKNFKMDFCGKNCLFIGYACEDDAEMFVSSAKDRFLKLGMNIIDLTEHYDFSDKIDVIFARGGNTTKLVHLLRKNKQYEKILSLVKDGVLYVGNSAGTILIGSDTKWTLDAEPYDFDVEKQFGKDALKGFGLIDKLLFVHCSKYRMCRDYEMENETDIFRTLDLECYPDYLKDLKKFKKDEFIRIGNNQALFVDGTKQKMLTYDWRKIPVKKKGV